MGRVHRVESEVFDVLEAAAKRRQELKAELKRVDEFFSYAEWLVKATGQESRPAPARAEPKEPSVVKRPEVSTIVASTLVEQELPRSKAPPQMNGKPPLFRGALTAG